MRSPLSFKSIAVIASEFKSMTLWEHTHTLPLSNEWRAERIKYNGQYWVFAFNPAGEYRGNYCESQAPLSCWNYLVSLAAGTSHSRNV